MHDILDLIMEFYIIKQIEADMQLDEFKNSHIAWQNTFDSHAQEFVNVFHNMIWDYTVLACGGELRHAKNSSTKYHPDIPIGGTRSSCMSFLTNYTRESVSQVAIDLFHPDCKWTSGYGGHAWYRIANVLNMVHKLPKDVWIDHCVDLAHNNGSYFNKTSAGVFSYNSSSRTKMFLDYKRNGIVWNYTDYLIRGVQCSRNLHEIIMNAIKLSILPQNVGNNVRSHCKTKARKFSDNYNPIKWGKKSLSQKYKQCGSALANTMREYRYENEERYA